MKKTPKIEEYQTINWPQMEAMTDQPCPCCGEKFNENMHPELTGKCHTGPVYVSYWDGFLYMRCGKCEKPICRVAVDKSLL
jgi:hypothetical protein